jgi:peptidoglycan/LPS O-acetylase OafA/YrhL
LSFGVAFTKVPLSTAEALRYLTIIMGIITVTDVLWPFIGDSAPSAFVQTLGRKSLPVYAVHLWVVEAMGIAAVAWPWMGAWQFIFVPFSILALWFFALILDVSGDTKKKRPVPTAAVRPSLFRPDSMAGAAR